jgi:glutathione peroxidase
VERVMTTAYDFEFKAIDGKPLPLSQFKGHPILVVNVASKCGLTPQYDGLEKLYADYRGRGLVVLGVPSNQFMGQEPGTEAEIQEFCRLTYGVDFPMTAKTDVKGDTAHPFYVWSKQQLGEPAEPIWNFHKLLVDKAGKPVRAFDPRTEPLSPDLIKAVEETL